MLSYPIPISTTDICYPENYNIIYMGGCIYKIDHRLEKTPNKRTSSFFQGEQ